MFRRMIVASAVLSLGVLAPSAAQAIDRKGVYGYGSIGTLATDVTLTGPAGTRQRDAVGSQLRAGTGLRWSRYAAVEIEAHSTLGKAPLGDLGSVGSAGLRGAVVGIVPLGRRVELSGRLSAGRDRIQWNHGEANPFRVTVDTPLRLGVGAYYWINDKAAIRLDIEQPIRRQVSTPIDRREVKAGAAALGLQYRFP